MALPAYWIYDPASEIINIAEACPRRPDFVLVDYELPFGYSGLDVVGDLRAVSGESGLRTLRKPLNAQDLLAAILELIAPSEMPSA